MQRKSQTILFLLEMPITNGVIQAQTLPVILACAKKGYKTEILETTGRFDSQEKFRLETQNELEKNNVRLKKIIVPRHTFLPSILYFTWKSKKLLRDFVRDNSTSKKIIYARNYKFCPLLLWANYRWNIPFIYSPRGAYVAERKFYRTIKDRLYAVYVKILEKATIKKSQATILETKRFKEYLIDLYKLNDGSKMKVIYNYYNSNLLPPPKWDREAMRAKMGFTGKKVLVYAGTAEVWYSFSQMFDLAARLKKREPELFFQLFLKEDYARDESRDILSSIDELALRHGFQKGKDFSVSSYPPGERYFYLAACDAGLCLTTRERFKTMMLYLKIVDYLGAGLPIIVNQDVLEAEKIIKEAAAGAILDYDNWEKSISDIDLEKLFNKKTINQEKIKAYSSLEVIPQYLALFEDIFSKSD